MPTCREYEIMGYPTIKFFSPNTLKGDMGTERQNREKTVPSIKADMVRYLTDVQLSGKGATSWPRLVPASVSGLELKIWDSGAVLAILMVETVNATLGSEVMLDTSQMLRELSVPLVLAKVEITAQTDKLLQKLQVDRSSSSLVAISRDFSTIEILSSQSSREAWAQAIRDFIWKKSDLLSPKKGIISGLDNSSREEKQVASLSKPRKTAASRKEVMARRYKVYTTDLEKAVLYAISHEVAQHSSITSHTLHALQKFVTVLEKYFPGRVEMTIFLRDLHGWVHKHQDAVRGEDLSAWMSSYQAEHGLGPHKDWLGCRGSEEKYGGYPCGLWSVWHTLTVSQANLNQGDPKEVLLAMKGYIKEFFGCRECARHFDQTIDGGKLIDEEVKTHNDALLLLWRVHNKANQRLAGDISEDPVFPKLIFPSKEFCSSCYDGTVTGTNLWVEFNKNSVLQFLKNMYSKEKLSSQGLIGSSTGERHALVALPADQLEENVETFDTSNYKKEENSSNFIFFNGADLSICFVLWFISAVLLVLIYLKFVAGKKFSNSFFFNGLKRKTNPLLGKV